MNDPQKNWADLEAKQKLRDYWLRRVSKRPAQSDLIEKWLAGSEFVELPIEQLAILEAYLKQSIDIQAIQAERKRNRDRSSETCDRRNKLKLLRDYNRELLRLRQTGGVSADAEAGAETESATTARKKPAGKGKRPGRPAPKLTTDEKKILRLCNSGRFNRNSEIAREAGVAEAVVRATKDRLRKRGLLRKKTILPNED